MVTKWYVYRKWEPQGFPTWVACAPNGTETEHPSHAAALNHATTEQRKAATLAALILQTLIKAKGVLSPPA